MTFQTAARSRIDLVRDRLVMARNKLSCLIVALTICCGGAVTAQTPLVPSIPPQPTPHNIVVIIADDVGVDMVGAYEQFYANHPTPGYPNTTPTIDYLAQSGLVFQNCWASPTCSPTRAQILSGRHGLNSGISQVTKRDDPRVYGLDHSIPIIPTILRNSAVPYDTAAVGKWHLAAGNPANRTLERVHALGTTFPWFHVWGGNMIGVPGGVGGTYNSWNKVWAADPGWDPCGGVYPCINNTMTYATTDTANDAQYFVENLQEPFFLHVAFNAAHTPLNAPGTPLAQEGCSGFSTSPLCPGFGTDTPTDTRCLVQWLDNELARVVCAIENGPFSPDLPTTIIFIGDNGTAGCPPGPGGGCDWPKNAIVRPFEPFHCKGTVYQGGVHVPMIIKSPYMSPSVVGTSTDVLVGATDIMATVADLAGASLPNDPNSLLDTVSMYPYMMGQTSSDRDYVYADRFFKNFIPDAFGNPTTPVYKNGKHWQALRNVAGYKLIRRTTKVGGGGVSVVEELYNLNSDPHEVTDLFTSGVPADVAALAALQLEMTTSYPHLVQ